MSMEQWSTGVMGRKSGKPVPCPRNPLLQHSITPKLQEKNPELFSITGLSFIQEKVKPEMQGWG
jgi:hypothetical protein